MPETHPVIAIVQARMSSSRLPGKVLMPIAGKPLLWHIAHRLGQCRTVDGVAIATSVDGRDDAIEAFCAAEGIICVRGSLTDVLDRYRLAAERTGAQTLLRVTGDSPLIDPGFVDYLVGAMLSAGKDYAIIQPGALCAHEGVDVFSRNALEWLVRHAGQDPIAREHVTSYFKLHPDMVGTVVVPPYPPLEYPHGRLSVDTVDDLAFIRALYERLGAGPGELNLTAVLELIREDAGLRQINAHVRQKSIGQVERHVLIVCEGGSKAGLGHVRRGLSLARALRDVQGFGVTMALLGDESAAGVIRAASFDPLLSSPEDIKVLAAGGKFSVAVVDVKEGLTRADVAGLAGHCRAVAVIDDGSDRRLAASHAYYPPVPQARALDWTGSTCHPRIGWEWCVLGFDPGRIAAGRTDGRRLVVSMGGADPLDLTGLALDALQGLKLPLHADIVIGPAFARRNELLDRIEKAGPHVQARDGVAGPAEIFAGADLALVAFGVTAYELAALGVPALYLAISDDHARSASAFADAGLGQALGMNVSAAAIETALAALASDPARRAAMHEAGLRLVDGKGALRIAAELGQAVTA
jgi:spore coat polysaccharide biosynthesis protein SpsF